MKPLYTASKVASRGEHVARNGNTVRQNTARQRKIRQHVIIALVSFMVAASLLHQIIPSAIAPLNASVIGPKYAYYQAHKDDYDALFFGSSRVHYHISPEVFDRVASEAGVPLKSFNFGVAGLKPMQTYVLLRDILQDPPAHLKWVFCEDVLDFGGERLGAIPTHRSIYWHTAANTRLAINYVLSNPYSTLLEKVGYTLSHLAPFLSNQLNVGRIFYRWFPDHHPLAEDTTEVALYLANEGYLPLTEESATREDFLNTLDSYQKDVAQLAEAKRKPITANDAVYFEPVEQPYYQHLEKITTAIEAAGATPIFVVAPTTIDKSTIHRAYYLKKIPHLLSFNHPDEYPKLFDVAYRKEADHLTPEGAEYFTELLAQKFTQTVLQQSLKASDEKAQENSAE